MDKIKKKMKGKYRVVELYRRGEKVYAGKQYRIGWRIYRCSGKGEWKFDGDLMEGKE